MKIAEIEYLEEHKLAENAMVLGDHLMDQLHELKETYPLIGNVVGKGFHIGIDLVKDRATKEIAVEEAEQIMYDCLEMGVAFKIIEGNIITIRPSLIHAKGDCDLIIDALKKALEKF